MPIRLTTVLAKVAAVPRTEDRVILESFYLHMKGTGTSESYQCGNLKAMLQFASFSKSCPLVEINRKEDIVTFLNTKIRPREVDPDQKWITTWNDYLWRIKFFYRWLKNSQISESCPAEYDEAAWKTPNFVRISKKRTKRLNPYSETEIWEKEELLSIIKYERHPRNKAEITLFWDLDARNHEVTKLRIKNVRLRETYGEGEVPYDTKTGGGPKPLSCHPD